MRPEARDLVRGMIYPVPDPRYPFLGVHLTRGVDDGVHVGPNTVLALGLEGYRWRDVDWGDLYRMASWPGTWRLAARHWRQGVAEVAGWLLKRRYLAEVQRYLPELALADFSPTRAPGYKHRRRPGKSVDRRLRPAGRRPDLPGAQCTVPSGNFRPSHRRARRFGHRQRDGSRRHDDQCDHWELNARRRARSTSTPVTSSSRTRRQATLDLVEFTRRWWLRHLRHSIPRRPNTT